ncbi:DUF2851 family protein [Leptobacterium flavescens]|uniref:DUF2851 family protein n=1 Tax=Leptobacterium flavescens TaxID=472055 RepID=A0A6P0UGF5_9FLAO|nr:DUF2851 family protein [Leptobacterium flavescens]NER12324.1 DUF2851 family protein [Leptobacterium flavescens]
MKEEFLHYLWKFGRFENTNLYTTRGERLQIFSVGVHNHNSGPDFFNAKISLDDQLWAGNVEIHLRSSDWYAHHHQKDKAYDNVILHVVWEDDIAIFRSDNSIIPTLELKNRVEEHLLSNYEWLFKKGKSFINCEKQIVNTDKFILESWKERLYIERLEQKSAFIMQELEDTHNDWEAVLFRMLLKNFGLKINGQAFYQMSAIIDFNIVRKLQHKVFSLEALLFGVAGFLEKEEDIDDDYRTSLKKEYHYIKRKFNSLYELSSGPVFFRLRPVNFPTIRLSQFAGLYHKHRNLFSEILRCNTTDDFFELFRVSASVYWKDHYTFGKESASSDKKLSKEFISLLIINTVIPLKFCYAKSMGKEENDTFLKLIASLKAEKNSITNRFDRLHLESASAKDSQAFIQLYDEYCSKNRCLSCNIGNTILNRSAN